MCIDGSLIAPNNCCPAMLMLRAHFLEHCIKLELPDHAESPGVLRAIHKSKAGKNNAASMPGCEVGTLK